MTTVSASESTAPVADATAELAAATPFVKAGYRMSRLVDIGRGIACALCTAIAGRPGDDYRRPLDPEGPWRSRT
jgi:hypothetical protein